jgi:hypothetical protein
MPNQSVSDKTSGPEQKLAAAAFASAARLPVPRCECCGALIQIHEPMGCFEETPSCIVCRHRNP